MPTAKAILIALAMSGLVSSCSQDEPSDPPAQMVAATATAPPSPRTQTNNPVPSPAPSMPAPASEPPDSTFETREAVARFMTQATFGPTPTDLRTLTGGSASQWFISETQKPASLNLRFVDYYKSLIRNTTFSFFNSSSTTFAFWKNAIEGDDQLRQRTAFALSEILVLSNAGGDLLYGFPELIGYHQDLLTNHAFGNYRDLLEAVTYSPGMGIFLTYNNNLKGDPETGRRPDENYAREILQLFTIGLVELNIDGTPKLDANGTPIETYTNDDITGLARVFTGLHRDRRHDPIDGNPSELSFRIPMVIEPGDHSDLEKQFLGTTIAPGTDAATSIDIALDAMMAHPNVAPFISRQLIQRFVTSHPTPDYIARVANAFNGGRYKLPDGTVVGDGRKGDLQATIAAVLFDPQARELQIAQRPEFGKVREPLIRFTNWVRAFNAGYVTPEFTLPLWDTSNSGALNQHPYRSPSVFNFFRPGYVAPRTLTGDASLTMPELQIVNASTTPGYANFINYFILEVAKTADTAALRDVFRLQGVNLDPSGATRSFIPNYSFERDLAVDANRLIDHLDTLLTFGTLTEGTRAHIITALNELPVPTSPTERAETLDFRVKIAIMMIMASPDYIVQR